MQFINSDRQEGLAKARHPASFIGSIGSLLSAGWFPNNQRAQLKRYRRQSGGPGEMVALRVLALSGVPIETMPPAEIKAWIWLVHCMALFSGPNRDPHSISSDARPGRIFQKAGLNDFRLSGLLEARGELFQALLERALRRALKVGEPLNWAKLAPLILPRDPESRWAGHARIEIARDFAVAAARIDSNKEQSVDEFAAKPSLGYDADD